MAKSQLHSAELKQEFDRDGFVVLRGFLAPSEVDEVIGRVDRFIAEVIPTLPPAEVYYEVKGQNDTLKQFAQLRERDAFFRERLDEHMAGLAETLLGGPCIAKSLQWFNKPPVVGKGTPPHQDGFFFMLDPNEAVTMWLALDRVDANNGCIRYVPGSHRMGLRPHARTSTLGFSQGIENYGFADLEKEVAIHAAPGDLLVHHSLTIHRADANQSDRHRRALGQVFYASWAREDTERQAQYQAKLSQELLKAGKV